MSLVVLKDWIIETKFLNKKLNSYAKYELIDKTEGMADQKYKSLSVY